MDYTPIGNDDLGWAMDCITYVRNMQRQWGRQYDAAKDARFKTDQIVRAAGILLDELAKPEDQGPKIDAKAALTKATRQATAAKAREAKANKAKKEAQDKLGDALQEIQTLGLALDKAYGK